ncbi:MAG: sigma-70 family RNA polymerase sigma factor [Okeania sp. SIO3H1]|nr:sigma-70 family RNA polymerase sigma factor [Okeania sp. SIO3H1]
MIIITTATESTRRHLTDNTLIESESSDIISQFWQQWQESQDQLYRCCLKMMNSNRADAEDALSRAMLKAWEKVQKFGDEIANLKAWLYRVTRNFCLDIIRERSRGAAGVESIEWVGNTEEISTAATVECPESVLEKEERSAEIRRAIAELPERLRETFVLHLYQELAHQEIAQEQGISYDNVCKRISQARKILKQKLSSYFIGQDGEVGLNESARSREITPTPKVELVCEVVAEKTQAAEDLLEATDGEGEQISEPTRETEERSPECRKLVLSSTGDEKLKEPEEAIAESLDLIGQRKIREYDQLLSYPDMAQKQDISYHQGSKRRSRPQEAVLSVEAIAPVLVSARYSVLWEMLELLCWQGWINSGGVTEVKSRPSTSRQIDSS